MDSLISSKLSVKGQSPFTSFKNPVTRALQNALILVMRVDVYFTYKKTNVIFLNDRKVYYALLALLLRLFHLYFHESQQLTHNLFV